MGPVNLSGRNFGMAAALGLMFLSVSVAPSQTLDSARSRCAETPSTQPPFTPTGANPASRGSRFFGTAKLSVLLNTPWSVHQRSVRWFSDDAQSPAPVNLQVTGHRLDPDVTFMADPKLRDSAPKFTERPAVASRGYLILSSIEFPTPGCWEITARMNATELRFIAYVQR